GDHVNAADLEVFGRAGRGGAAGSGARPGARRNRHVAQVEVLSDIDQEAGPHGPGRIGHRAYRRMGEVQPVIGVDRDDAPAVLQVRLRRLRRIRVRIDDAAVRRYVAPLGGIGRVGETRSWVEHQLVDL